MKRLRFLTRNRLIGAVLGTVLTAGVLVGCGAGNEGSEGPESGVEGTTEQSGEGVGEHGAGGEGTGGESGGEGGSGGEEASGNMLTLNQTFDQTRAGARLVIGYDASTNSFVGTVENTTNNTLIRVRIEAHLSNGVELGPTTPVDLAPGEILAVDLPATAQPFTGWTPHAEVGRGEGTGGESGVEGPEGSGVELNEAAMSSPVVPLDQTWNGNLGGLAVSAWYDAATQTVHSTVQNTTSQALCYVQAEPHLKSGTQTVGELGPDVLGHLSPGQTATSSVALSTEPALAGVSFDGYVIHMEIFDCAGSGPVPHTGGEGGGGEGAGGEGHGPGGEGGSESGSEGGSGGEEGSGNMLTLDQTFDQTRAGARLILGYDASTNSFKGTVENTTNNTLTRVRIEVHLSNGVELGPTTPVDMAPGQILAVDLPATAQSFTGWTPHAEVGSGEGGGGGEGSEGGGREGGNEHGSGEEHGSGGEGDSG
ncbi:MAG: hypothetical protein OXS33_04410 [bacterium]|nr:hypothetical protein [bacterium]